MDLEDAMENWSSVKKFTDEEVEREKLEKIFELTTKAPTAFNLQPYRFIVLDSEEAMEKATSSVIPVNGWIRYADKIVVLVGDEEIDVNADQVLEHKLEEGRIDEEKAENLRKMYFDYKNRDSEFMTGWLTRNTVIPATFFMLACKTHGIGSCPVRGFDQDKLSEKLDLKETERPILIFPIGYPKEEDRNWRRPGGEIFEIR
ncbi:nitroreductase family protein [Candidatus Nanohalobium constans]|uniref:Putative NAD(P)H nitroreductase n=1 Tax=Candidatus Nanohalobium constans TaxID=2565781 RepID=A0A5Q0UFD9_9ARCH|nr:nitroreductase family protein [Candidatus Nanohalobium constans]QGA80234.1 putative NAD(P)H nitroreductase [Candidatus Nanohalobium constans]